MKAMNNAHRQDLFYLLILNTVFVIVSLAFIPFLPQTASFEWFNAVVVYPVALSAVIVSVTTLLGSLVIWFIMGSDTHPYNKNHKVYRHLLVLLIVAFNSIGFNALLNVMGIVIPLEQMALIVFGLGLMFTGNLFPKIKPNYVFGVRNPFTLANDVVWIKTHQFTGYLYLVGGGIILANLLFTPLIQIISLVIVLLSLMAAPFIYSMRKFNQLEKKRSNSSDVEN